MIKIFTDEAAVAAQIAADMSAGLDVEAPVFCLASGSTPAKGYKMFYETYGNDERLSKLNIVSLDEWVGIEKHNNGSCYGMLDTDLFKHLNMLDEQIVFYDGTGDLTLECARVDEFIEKNPMTFSLMGVGMNGHIGLNEPGFVDLDKSSVVGLSPTTKTVAQKYFDEPTVLEEGITLGLFQIIKSERVLVVITGAHKADIVKKIIEDKDATLPATRLLGFEHITFYLDEAAASKLTNKGG